MLHVLGMCSLVGLKLLSGLVMPGGGGLLFLLLLLLVFVLVRNVLTSILSLDVFRKGFRETGCRMHVVRSRSQSNELSYLIMKGEEEGLFTSSIDTYSKFDEDGPEVEN